MSLHVFKSVKVLQILGEFKRELGGNHTIVFHFHNQSYQKYEEYLWGYVDLRHLGSKKFIVP